jgi:integrase
MTKWRDQCAAMWQKGRHMEERDTAAEMLSDEASKALYERALSEGAAIANMSVSQKFEDSRQKTWDEFLDFLGRVGRGVNVQTASNLDVIAFIQGVWLPAHVAKCRTRTKRDGEKVASASAVKGVIQHISKSYNMLGFQDVENPAKQENVKSYSEGYRFWLKERGVREKRAKVMKEGKVDALTDYLERRIAKSEGISCCVLMTDLAAVDYLWESWARGKECGQLRSVQVDFEGGASEPGWSKTVRTGPSCRIDLSEGGRGRFLRSAAALIGEMERQGHASKRGFLFRPLNRARVGFEDTAPSAGALRKRIQQHMKDAGIFNGETLHSFRRSAVQNAASIEGYDVRRLMELGRWKSCAPFKVYVEEIGGMFPRR